MVVAPLLTQQMTAAVLPIRNLPGKVRAALYIDGYGRFDWAQYHLLQNTDPT